jgi:hypothetical protein
MVPPRTLSFVRRMVGAFVRSGESAVTPPRVDGRASMSVL